MYCKNCGAEVTGGNFCSYCGQSLTETTTSISLLNKAVSTANADDQYSLVLISNGSCEKVQLGDLLEDVFGYTDAESTNLISMAPVVVGENLTSTEAQTVAQFLTEYGAQVSITNKNDQYVDMTSNATSSVFDSNGKLLASVAAIIGALTVANRIKSYRRYKRPSLLDRLFSLNYTPNPPEYHRNFRHHLDTLSPAPRRTIRKSPPEQHHARPSYGGGHSNGGHSNGGPGNSHSHEGRGSSPRGGGHH